MATPIPKAKPVSSGMASIIGVLVVIVLVGAEYYYLTMKDELRLHPRPKTETSISAATQTVGSNRNSQPNSNKLPGQKGIVGKKGTIKAGQVTGNPPPGTIKPIDMGTMFGSKPGGPSIEEQVIQKIGEFEKLHVGLGIRALFLAVCLAMLFMQKPPEPKIGGARRYARNPKTIVVPMQVIWVLLGCAGIGLLSVGTATGGVLVYGYPLLAVVCLACGFVGGFLKASTIPTEGKLMAEKVRHTTEYAIVLNVEGQRYVNVPNPFRGTLVFGGAGAGKTYSIGEPFLEQFLAKGMAGLIYDFKFPVLAGATQKALLYAQPHHAKLMTEYQENLKNKTVGKSGIIEGLRKPIRHRVINFVDMERTEKVNPLRPQDMPTQAYAMEYATTILTNLGGGAKSSDNFFTKSAQAYLTAIIWYYRNNYPALCTVPHVVATAVYKDYKHVLHMLKEYPDCQVLAQSLITAVEDGADKQIAGVVSSLQVDMASLATAEISWVLAPDEDPQLGDEVEGFSLNLNDPDNPTILTIGNDPTLAKTFSPVISCVVAVALKLMNQQRKHPSFVLIDEGATIYVPGLEVIPATARSNRVAMLYMTQDMAQLIDAYGKDKAQVLVSNLNNQFYGKINSKETADLVSGMIGREDVEMVSINTGQSMGGQGSSSKGQSVSVQERQVFRTQDAYTLRQGEFVGQTVETDQPFFLAQMEREVEPGEYGICKFTFFEVARGVVSYKIRTELGQIITTDKVNLKGLETERVAEEIVVCGQERQERTLSIQQRPPRKRGKAGQRRADILTDEYQENQDYQDTTEAGESADNQAHQQEPLDQENSVNQKDLDWAVADLTEESPRQNEAAWKPSAAQQQQLDIQAAHARHQRERLKRATEGSQAEQNTTEEVSDQQEAEKRIRLAAERTTRFTGKATSSTVADMVAANHKRIAQEVVKAIENSGTNSLSKEALQMASAANKRKKEAEAAQKEMEAGNDSP